MRILAARSTGSLALLALTVGGCVAPETARNRPDSYSLGRNTAGEPCTTTRNWRDGAVTSEFDQSWTITCRNVSASRPVGSVRVFASKSESAAARAALDCGEARPARIDGVGAVEARLCQDQLLASRTVAFAFVRHGHQVLVSASPVVLGPAEEAARLVTGAAHASTDAGRAAPAQIPVATLPPAPALHGALAGTEFDPAVPLAEGINLNHKGLHVEASRVLNDALSRLPANAVPAARAELLLEAGLADSNIRFEASATQHFDEADALLPALRGENGDFLRRKRDAYRALDLLNQRKFHAALAALDRLATRPAAATQPLQDPAIVRMLNQGVRRHGDVANAIALPETAALAQLTLDAQANWARSVALLALGDADGAQAALDRAVAAYAPLMTERIDPTLVLWLGAQIDRQAGRLQDRRKQYPEAIASFDRALVQLRRSAIGTAGTGNEPAIAETQLERAGIVADAGTPAEQVRNEYDAAVEAMIAATQSGGGVVPIGIERYLDLLVAEADAGARADTYERFFRAVQVIGEPAVARQLSQLQSVVTGDPALGVKVRDRAEIERDITRLRYDIAAGGHDAATTADLEKQRQVAEGKLQTIEGELSSDPRFRTIDDRPATIAEVRGALKPGEAYFKLSQLNRRTYGVLITAERTWVYAVVAPNDVLNQYAAKVRGSIDGKLDKNDELVQYDVPGSYTLFRLLTGPATDALLHAGALVVDPSGPLQTVPAGVLVTDRASVDRFAASKAAAPFDFSHVGFLAAHAALSTAVSPRSFLVARALPPSAARQPFLGLGEHVPAPDGGPTPQRLVSVGFGCSVSFDTLAALSRRLTPIDKKELAIASTALGDPNAPEITGAGFSDTAIEARTDLADFEVLHFATHGLKEGVWGCSKSPPALVTSFGDQDSDGLLSFSEIARLRLDANLVVLSACDTSSGVKDEALARQSGQEEAGSTLEGLVRAFLTANTRAVLATYWPVSAEGETDEFIRAFYGSARRADIGVSLQTAQKLLMTNPRYSHPFFWGPYFVVGDATKMMLSGAAARVAKQDGAARLAAN